METGTERPWEDQKLWLRLLIMIVLGFFYWFCQFIIFAFAVAQLGFLLVSGERCDPIHRVSFRLSIYVKQLVDFLLFTSETRPFPFSDFPEHQAAQPAPSSHSAPPSAASTATSKAQSGAEESTTNAPRKTTRKKKSSGKKRSRKATESTNTESTNTEGDAASGGAATSDDKENES